MIYKLSRVHYWLMPYWDWTCNPCVSDPHPGDNAVSWRSVQVCLQIFPQARRLTQKRRNCWLKSLFLFSFWTKSMLNHWFHMDYFNNVLTTFLSIECGSCVAVYAGSKSTRICVLKMNKDLIGLGFWSVFQFVKTSKSCKVHYTYNESLGSKAL